MTVTKGYALGDVLTEIMHKLLQVEMPPHCMVSATLLSAHMRT